MFGEAKASDVVHSMVIKYPPSGQPALYVNPQFTTKILGLSEIESARLLKTLLTIACAHTYNAASGMVAMTLPCGTTAGHGTKGHRCLMHRITVEGCAFLDCYL